MITIVDYGMGNLGSILNMLKYIKAESTLTSDPGELAQAQKIVLPGVGAFDTAMKRIHELDLFGILNHKALEQRVPLLGICLGMQLMTRNSEEGDMDGFSWIPAETVRFCALGDGNLKIPHMGWNHVKTATPSKLTEGFESDCKFYFLHSYYVKVDRAENCILKACYGIEFDAAIKRDNLYGVQFHPEKSHKYGMKLLQNFANI